MKKNKSLFIDYQSIFSIIKNPSTTILEQVFIARKYREWVVREISPFVKGNVLEIGCGVGSYTPDIYKKANYLVACDKDINYIKALRKYQKHNLKFVSSDITSPLIRNLGKNKFDTAIMINILEHIKNDQSVIKKVFHLLNQNGKFIIFVPAMPILYGPQDMLVGHFRRYTKKELNDKLTAAGFKILKTRYFNFFGSFGWFFQNRIMKKIYFSSVFVKIYDFFVPFFTYFESKIEPPFGQSLICIVTK